MSFIKAVWYLKDKGYDVKPSDTFSNHKRLYTFIDDDSTVPMLLSRRAIQSMADLLENGMSKDTYPLPLY